MTIHTLTVALRSLLGLIFVVAPLSSALHLVPEPQLPPGGAAFVDALAQTGYMLPLLWATEITAGTLLLSGWMVPFGLVLLAPVVVNIVAFHIFLAPTGVGPAVLVTALELFLTWQHRGAFSRLFGPSAGSDAANTIDGSVATEPGQAVLRSRTRQ